MSSDKIPFSTVDTENGKIADMDFATWLNAQMAERGMSQSDLARAAKVSNTAISNVLSGMRSPGPELCTAIAKAFRLPAVYVFRMAGLLPPEVELDERTERMIHAFEQLTPSEKEIAVAMVQAVVDLRKGGGQAYPREG